MAALPDDVVESLRKIGEAFVSSKLEGWSFAPMRARVGGSAAVFALQKGDELKGLKLYAPVFFQGEGASAELRRIELQKRLVGTRCESLMKIESLETFAGTCVSVMEYIPWDELNDCLGEISKENIQPLVDQLIAAVSELGDAGLIHRDIKPENILISPDRTRLKLVDLGVVREISTSEDRFDSTDHGNHKPFLATAQYSPPEYLFRTLPPSAALWNALNVYQVGAVVHDLLMQTPLFAEEYGTGNRYSLALAVLSRKPHFTESARARNRRLATVAEASLVKDPTLRLNLVSLSDFAEPPTATPAVRLQGLLERLAHSDDFDLKLNARRQANLALVQAKLDSVFLGVFDSLNTFSNSSLTLGRNKALDAPLSRILVVSLPSIPLNYQFTLDIEEPNTDTDCEATIYLSNDKESTSRSPQGSICLNGDGSASGVIERIVAKISETIVEAAEQ